jgi:hypothetical protein
MYQYENIETNILKPKFFLETIQLMQRGNIETQQKGLEFLYNNKNENTQEKDFHNFIDSLEISKFVDSYTNNKTLTKSDIEELNNEFINEYFLRKDKFDKYLADFYDYKDFENIVWTYFDIDQMNLKSEDIKDFFNKKLIEFKKDFSETNKNKIKNKREEFSLDKTNLEQYSRIKKIFNILKDKNVEEKVFTTDYKLYLSGLSKNILNTYSEKFENISSFNYKEQILLIAETAKSVAVIFDDIKNNLDCSENKLFSKIEPLINNKNAKKDIDSLNPLMGKSMDSKGNDFFVRLYDKLQNIDESLTENENKTKNRRSVWSKKNIENSKINNNVSFRQELRKHIVNLVRSSPIKINIQNYSKSFIFDKLKFQSIPEFSYPEELKNNPYNISIQGDISKDININIQILLIILESAENQGDIYEFFNKETKQNMEKFYKKTNISKDFLQKSLMDIINYEIFLSSKYNEIDKKINNKEETINIKKEISFSEMETTFNDYNQFVNLVKNIYSLNKIEMIKDKETLIKKITIFNNDMDLNSILEKLPISTIDNLKKLSKNEIEKISNMNLSIINFYEEKQINDLLLEQKSLNMLNNLIQ